MVKDLTAKNWIKTHGTQDLGGNYNLTDELLDEFLAYFILPHKECNCYSKGLCTHKDAPNPGHSRCVGTHLCLTPDHLERR